MAKYRDISSEILRYQHIAQNQFFELIYIKLLSQEKLILQELEKHAQQSTDNFAKDILSEFPKVN